MSNSTSIEWIFEDGEKVTFSIPLDENGHPLTPDGEYQNVLQIYDALKKESHRRLRWQAIQVWAYRLLVTSLITGWWILAFIFGNTYCK